MSYYFMRRYYLFIYLFNTDFYVSELEFGELIEPMEKMLEG